MSEVQAAATSRFGVINPSEIIVPSISSLDLDSNLEKVLLPFIKDGRDVQFGVVLIKGLCGSRPRRSETKANLILPTTLKTVNTTCVMGYRGFYVLREDLVEKPSSLWKTVKDQSSEATEINNSQFFDGLSIGCEVGFTSADLEANTAIRTLLNLRLFPITHGVEQLKRLAMIRQTKYWISTYINIATTGSVARVKTSPAGMTTIIYNHSGSPRVWIVVPSTQKEKFEDVIRGAFGDQLNAGEECFQFVSHLGIFLTPELLQNCGINFTLVEQEKKEIVTIFPHSYYWGYARGYTVTEHRLWNMSSWTLDDSYKFCSPGNELCSRSHETPDAYLYLNQNDVTEAENYMKAKRDRKRKVSTAEGEDDTHQDGGSNTVQPESIQDTQDQTSKLEELELENHNLYQHIAALQIEIEGRKIVEKAQSDALEGARADRRGVLDYIDFLKRVTYGNEPLYYGNALACLETLRGMITGNEDDDVAGDGTSPSLG